MASFPGSPEPDTFSGGPENDFISGGAGPDSLSGGGGNDSISGGTGTDFLDGGDGDDTLQAGPNLRYRSRTGFQEDPGGSEDDDEIELAPAGAPSDTVQGGAGIDTLVINYRGVTNLQTNLPFTVTAALAGNQIQVFLDDEFLGEFASNVERFVVITDERRDEISTGDRDDFVDAGGGDDAVATFGGADTIVDGGGRIDIDAGRGVDTIFLSRSQETRSVAFSAADGRLRIGGLDFGTARGGEIFALTGGLGADSLTGGAVGANTLSGGAGADTLTGGGLGDTLDGSLGADVIVGLGGADYIDAGPDADAVAAGDGDDTVYAAATDLAPGETMSGGGGTDTLLIDLFGVPRLDLSRLSISGFERLDDDNFGAAALVMTTAQLRQFREVAFASTNRVALTLADDADIAFGGVRLGLRTLKLAEGGQRADLRRALPDAFLPGLFPEVLGGSGNDTVLGRDAAGGGFAFRGGAGDDVFTGGASIATVWGDGGDDTLRGGASTLDTARFSGLRADYDARLLPGGAVRVRDLRDGAPDGVDILTGFERLWFSDPRIMVGLIDTASLPAGTNAAPGRPALSRAQISEAARPAAVVGRLAAEDSDGDGVSFRLVDDAGGRFRIAGGALTLARRLDFEAAQRHVVTVAAEDGVGGATTRRFTVSVLDAVETRAGGSGADRLTGGIGRDVLKGLGGADRLDGKGARDTLEGGSGRDSFVFSTAPSAANVDTLADFSPRDDTVLLARAVFRGIGRAGDLPSDAFHQGARAADAEDRVIHDPRTGRLMFDPDGSGSRDAILFATLDRGLRLTAADIDVI